jgi:Pyruvate/2-oxoacid:ferredoxin oxidoreductase delta subunit
MKASTEISRRELFSRLFHLGRNESALEHPSSLADKLPKTAVVQGRFCLAYRNSFCSVCSERCPVPGAIVTERGFPRVNPALCTGCAICHDLCPAPRNAILMIPKRTETLK